MLKSLVVLLAFQAGCHADRGDPLPVVSDRSGVRVVSYSATALDDVPRWTIEPAPFLSLGVVEGDPAEEFGRVITAVPTEQGVVVADGGSLELRLFEWTGQPVQALGGSGRGPGEFQYLSWVQRGRADSLYVWDEFSRRLTVVSPEFHVTRTFSPQVPGVLTYVGILPDGTLIASLMGPQPPTPTSGGLLDGGEIVLVAVDPAEPSAPDTIGRVAGRSAFLDPDHRLIELPFTTMPRIELAGRSVWFGNGSDLELRRWHPASGISLLVQLPGGGAITTDLVEPYRENFVRSRPEEERTRSIQLFADLELPDVIPAFDRMISDPAGHVWLGHFRREGGPTEEEWTVMDESGFSIGRVSLPAGVVLLNVDDEFVIVRERDDLGVDRILAFRLERHARQ